VLVHRQKRHGHSAKITLPLEGHRLNPLREPIVGMFQNFKEALPRGETVDVWKYDVTLESHLFTSEPNELIDGDNFLRDYRKSPTSWSGDALLVAVLNALHDLFWERTLDFDTSDFSAQAATALSKDRNVRKAALFATLEVLRRSGGQVPIAVPKMHPLAPIITALLSSQLSSMLPPELASIKTDMPRAWFEKMMSQEEYDRLKQSGIRAFFLEEIIELERKVGPDPRVSDPA
jgi:hypothetical protein